MDADITNKIFSKLNPFTRISYVSATAFLPGHRNRPEINLVEKLQGRRDLSFYVRKNMTGSAADIYIFSM